MLYSSETKKATETMLTDVIHTHFIGNDDGTIENLDDSE